LPRAEAAALKSSFGMDHQAPSVTAAKCSNFCRIGTENRKDWENGLGGFYERDRKALQGKDTKNIRGLQSGLLSYLPARFAQMCTATRGREAM